MTHGAADGRPLVAPVWFILDGEELVFTTDTNTAKGKALARDPRVALCVDLEDVPYAFVQVQGTATRSDDPDELLRVATSIAAPGELVVRVRPTKVVAVFDMLA